MSRGATLRRTCAAAPMLASLSGCGGIQSALDPEGIEAGEVAALFWTVTAVAVFVTILVTVLTAAAIHGSPSLRQRLAAHEVIVVGGIAFPVVVLSVLLVYGLIVMQAGSARSRAVEGPAVTITGKQWWWRVVYELPDGRGVISANELRLPVGEAVELRLDTEDVIHSFWAPKLGGKLDMIPGRTNSLTVEASVPGISRAQCAEYCGGAHALMSMYVVAMARADYDAWLRAQAEPAGPPRDAMARRGRQVFAENGCGACHAIRGTEAAGIVGPDLTHVGSRHSLAAATLPNDVAGFSRWITDNQHIKPANLMPPYRVLSSDDLQALAHYLDGLE